MISVSQQVGTYILNQLTFSINLCYRKCHLKLYGPVLWMGFNCLKATATSKRQFTFYHSVPRNSWYSFYRPRKDERLSRTWSHPVVLNTGLLDWESSVLTTRPLLLKCCFYMLLSIIIKTLLTSRFTELKFNFEF